MGIKALETDPALAMGLNVDNYQLVHPVVREVFKDLAARTAEFSLA